ncbi:ATP-binding protein [Saccharothrix variisporea]|uniref:AAA ATPase-like protein n=1 Tax=Saccharothrix variisporea TaxID=543527 RepID=A0A495X1K0_9PSEU|nr:ATP-binding protein [Saccharothrix variisporea]RKT67074.1 AAA ATPase-like protein [Saccharothrix variisporea]
MSTAPEEQRLVEAFLAGRSEAERRALVQRLAPPPPPPVAEDVVRAVRTRAALSGAVAPRDLVRGMPADEAERVLDVVAIDFDRALVGGDWRWTMRSGPREQTLVRLAAEGAVAAALAEVASVPTDEAGRTLRELAAVGGNGARSLFRTFAREKRDDRAVLQALTWVAPLGGRQGYLAEARRRAGLMAVRDSYATLLDMGVHGRDRELEVLRQFVAAPVDRAGPVPVLPVTGVGGAGKSTLLAALVEPHLDRQLDGESDDGGPVVVVIDFDRVVFRVNAELELSFEVTRQLGWAAPIAAADFSALRHQAREERRQVRTDLAVESVETDVRTATGFEAEARVLVDLHDLGRRTVVLVLDTFEEWQRDRPLSDVRRGRWNDPERHIQEWIWRLRHEMGLAGLRVVVSGRAPVSTMDDLVVVPPLELGELDASAAVRVITAFGVDREAAEALAGAVGGNPLALRVAARFYRKLSRAERRRFVATAHEPHPGLEHELRAAVLYDRFLSHIRDDRVRRLAHPGLVLRRVTPELVRHVLAPHCALGLAEGEEHRLVELLGDEVWLVGASADGLRHHPEVRRAVLRMMSGDPAHADRVRAVHRAAAEWYRSGRDPVLGEDAARAEALYHLLMLEDGRRSVVPVVGGDRPPAGVADFHPRVAAQLRALRGDDLGDEEALELPAEVWNRWVAGHGVRLLADGAAEHAVRLFEERLRRRGDVVEPEWLARACCDAARWRHYWPAVRRVGGGARVDRYALINALASHDPADLVSFDRGAVGESFLENGGGFLVLLRGRVPGVGVGKRDLYPVDELRRALVRVAAGESCALHGLSGLFRPDPEWLRGWSALVGGPASGEGRGLAEEIAAVPPWSLRSDELLGEWSARFARTWPRAVVSPERVTPDLVPVLRGTTRSCVRRCGWRRGRWPIGWGCGRWRKWRARCCRCRLGTSTPTRCRRRSSVRWSCRWSSTWTGRACWDRSWRGCTRGARSRGSFGTCGRRSRRGTGRTRCCCPG